jgi:creatinine amidohydrolase
MGHACEWETSMILRLNPKLVVGEVARVPEVPFGRALEPGHRAWVMPDRSEPGHIGTPSAATPEKGEALFAHFAGGVAAYLERVAAWDGSWDT